MCIRVFLRTYGLQIDFSASPLPEVQCNNDEFIMDALHDRGGCRVRVRDRVRVRVRVKGSIQLSYKA
jgi:hypothetical protein